MTLKDGAAASHPVEQIQKLGGAAGETARLQMLANVYGSGLPARMQIERQILDRQAILPGLVLSACNGCLSCIARIWHSRCCRLCPLMTACVELPVYPLELHPQHSLPAALDAGTSASLDCRPLSWAWRP